MEKKVSVRIETDIPITIFEKPVLKEHVSKLFDSKEEKIKTRINEILTFLGSDYSEKLSSDEIEFFFKSYFYKVVLNEAVKMTFSEEANFDALGNITSLLTNEKLENAIMGKTMIDAFSRAIRNLPTGNGLIACIHGGKIMLLEKEFLGKTIFPVFEKKQKNYCADCDCSCTCNSDCSGDTSKCTSEIALKKGCNHHCDCYITHMVENFKK